MNNNSKGTVAKGYGYKHKKLREQFKHQVALGQAVCWRCGKKIEPGSDWDLGHAEHPDAHRLGIYAGPECVPCNRATNRGRGTPVRIVDTSRLW